MVNKLVKGKTGSSIRFNKNTGWWRQRSCSFPLPSNEAEANALQAEEKAKCSKMDLSFSKSKFFVKTFTNLLFLVITLKRFKEGSHSSNIEDIADSRTFV